MQPTLILTQPLAVAVPTAATSLATGFLGHCLADAVSGLPYDVERVADLLADDDVYFLAAEQLVDPRLRRGWHAVSSDLTDQPTGARRPLAGYRARVLERGCESLLRNGFEVIFFGELALGAAPL